MTMNLFLMNILADLLLLLAIPVLGELISWLFGGKKNHPADAFLPLDLAIKPDILPINK